MDKQHTRCREVLFAAVIFLLPFVPKVVFRLPWLMLQNFTDGVFYLGYALHFRELVDRVGLNYYAVRFGGIWPDALAFSILGPEVGLIVVRYALAGACCLALYFVFWRRYSRGAGILAALAWAFNPAAVRFLQTAYVDVPAASFLCIGLGLVCLPRVGALRCFVAGALLASSFWGHLHAAVAIFFAGPLMVAVLLEQGWRRALLLLVWLSGGFLLTTITGAAFYYLHFGMWDLTSPTRELLQTLKDGHIPAPKLAWVDVVWQCPFWLGGLPLAIAALCVVGRDRILYGSLFAFVGYIAFLLWGDLVKGGYSLSLFYYFSFALPAFVFLVAAIIGNLTKTDCGWKAVGAFASVLCVPVLLIGWNVAATPWTWGILALSAAVPAAFLLPSTGRSFVIALGISGAMVLTAVAPTSRLALGNYWKGDDLPILTAAHELAAILPRYQRNQTPLVFWYDDKDGSDLRMLQSFHLHEFTKWKDAHGANISFPAAGADSKSTAWQGGSGELVVLAKTEAELQSALDSLKHSDCPPASIQRFQMPAALPIVQGAIVSFDEPLLKQVSSLIDRIEYHRKTKSTDSSPLEFETSHRKWNLDAVVPLPSSANRQAVKLQIEVKRGAVWVDIEEAGSEGRGLSPVLVSQAVSPETILFEFPNSLVPKRLRIRNASPHGVRSRVRIHEISMLEPIR